GGLTGAYTISMDVVPILRSVAPPFGAAGTSVPVALTGTRFGAPMTVIVGSGVTATDVNVLNATAATATLNVPGGIVPGLTSIKVAAPSGERNTLFYCTFPAIPPINLGDTVSASLNTTDGRNPVASATYADLYQLTLNSTTDVTIDLTSATFNTYLYL